MDEPISENSFEARLADVKNLPRKTDQERIAKKEAIRDYKIETMLSWAQAGLFFERMISVNPNISSKELESNLIKAQLPDKKVARRFVERFKQTRENVRQTINHFRNEAGLPSLENPFDETHWSINEKEEVGERVFVSIIGGKPQSEVNFIVSPYAVTISTNNKTDFEKLDKRENLGGYFNSSQALVNEKSVLIQKQLYDNKRYPLIVVGDVPKTVLDHELGHAFNSVLFDSLKKDENWEEYQKVWGGPEEKMGNTKPITNKEELSEFLRKKFLPRATSKAKDELIADLFATNNFDHLQNLLKKGGLYDYLEQWLIPYFRKKYVSNIPESDVTQVETEIWGLYKRRLTEAVESARDLLVNYQQTVGFETRVKLLPYLLMQIPLTKWKAVITKYFREETEAYRVAVVGARELSHRMSTFFGSSVYYSVTEYKELTSCVNDQRQSLDVEPAQSGYKIAKKIQNKTNAALSSLRWK